jgi:hypothetical protein
VMKSVIKNKARERPARPFRVSSDQCIGPGKCIVREPPDRIDDPRVCAVGRDACMEAADFRKEDRGDKRILERHLLSGATLRT